MPANVRILCKYIDCKFLNGLYCGCLDIEIDPKQSCMTYIPVEAPLEIDDEEHEADEEEEEEDLSLEAWGEEEDADDVDESGPMDLDE